MKNIIIKKEWIEILEQHSNELRDTVMSAIYDFALREKEPEILSPEAEIAYKLIKTEMVALDEALDFDAAREAAIRKKHVAERRAAKAAEQKAEQKKEHYGAEIITIEKNRTHKFRPLPKSADVPLVPIQRYDNYYDFKEFYDLYPGEKDDVEQEFSRLIFQFDDIEQEIPRFAGSLQVQIAWKESMKAKGYRVAPFPVLRHWLTDQCWRDKMPNV
ncbi:MAG: hypothetical protein K2O00_01115 [Muribaculaceae bacterium]|nr:hypothetical protein [Muribaculaceae bacterium]